MTTRRLPHVRALEPRPKGNPGDILYYLLRSLLLSVISSLCLQLLCHLK